MKLLIALYSLALCSFASANEDHLLLIPTPISNGDSIVIVHKPMISGYGAEFEGYCNRITDPYIADVRSPSNKKQKENINPASGVGIEISAELPNDNNRYKVTVDYSGVKDAYVKKDPYLLRAILTCIYMFGDIYHGYHKLKADVDLKGVDDKSELRAELTRFVEQRTQDVEKAKKENGGESPSGDTVYYVPR